MTTLRRRGNLQSITAARFFAALLVVIFHYNRKLDVFPVGIANFGYESVTFFFVLSGFILTYAHGRVDGLNISAGQFWRARAVRILPAYFLALLISLPFVVSGAIKAHHISGGVFLVPLMLQAWLPSASLLWNGPAWSLSNEMFFYALFPIAWSQIKRLDGATAVVIAFAMVFASSLLRLSMPIDTEQMHDFGAYFPLLNLPQFLLGVAIGHWFLQMGVPMKGALAALAASASALLAIIFFKEHDPWLGDSVILCAVFGAMILSLASLNENSPAAILAFGEASYAIYILHVPIWLWWDRIFRVTLNLDLPPIIDFTAYTASVIALSLVVTSVIDSPIRRWFRPRAVAA